MKRSEINLPIFNIYLTFRDTAHFDESADFSRNVK